MDGLKRLPAVFYRTSAGREPVRAWLKEMRPADRKIEQGRMVLLHSFIKKTQKTPAREIEVAVSRMRGDG
jgi:hypothetical protein